MSKLGRTQIISESEDVHKAPEPAPRPSLPEDSSSLLNLTPDRVAVKTRGKENADLGRHVLKPSSTLDHNVRENEPTALPNLLKFTSLHQPVIHSTALLEKKLHDLQVTSFNAEAAIEKELQQSVKLKNAIAEKASMPLNINKQENKYTDLVSLEVDLEEITKTVSQPRIMYKPPKQQDPVHKADIMQFFSEDFIAESAHINIPSIENDFMKPIGLPAENCLDYYKHMQSWK